jgi:MFS family permease
MVVSTGLLLGPPLGGYIISLAGWRWIFLINIPVCIFGIYFTRRFLGDFPISDPGKNISYRGAASLSVGLLTLMFAIMFFGRNMIGSQYVAGILIVSGMMFILFFYFENNQATRLIGLEIFKNRIFALSTTAMFLVFVSLASVTVLMPFYLEQVKHLEPRQVGLFLMVIPICTFFSAPLAGYLSDRIQARYITTIGISIMCLGVYYTKLLGENTDTLTIIKVLAAVGIGMGFFMTPNTSSIMGSVAKNQVGIASGINATIRTLGISFGVGLTIGIFEFYRGKLFELNQDELISFLGGYHTVYDYVIFIILAALLFSWLRGKNIRRKEIQSL